jgi:hypothetical protein
MLVTDPAATYEVQHLQLATVRQALRRTALFRPSVTMPKPPPSALCSAITGLLRFVRHIQDRLRTLCIMPGLPSMRQERRRLPHAVAPT